MLDLARKSASGVDRCVNLQTVFFSNSKVIGAVARCRMDAARARLSGRFIFKTNVQLDLGVGLAKRYVVSVHYQRSPVNPGVSGLEPVEL